MAGGGWIKAALLSPNNESIQNYSLDDSDPITTGAVKIAATWNGATELQLPPGEHVRIRFELKNASLYSFWLK